MGFPISTAIDALVESDDVEGWVTDLDANAVRDCLVEAIEQIRWFRENCNEGQD